MNDQLKNCISKLCEITERHGIKIYENIRRLAEQNSEEFETVYKPFEVCTYLIDLLKGPVFFSALSETDRVTLENCAHYIESVKPETENAV